MVWSTLAVTLILALVQPLWAIVFVIIYDLLWLIRVVYVLTYVLIAFQRYRQASQVDWLSRCRRPELNGRFNELYHLVVIPTYQDEGPVLESTFTSLAASHYPKDKMIVVLATEERDVSHAPINAQTITEKYGALFKHLMVTVHPANRPGELAGKGSNIAWAGRQAKIAIDQMGLAYDRVVVSSFDVDSCAHPEYFACLAYHYLTHPQPTRTSFQPIPLFNNNTLEAPAFTRVVANCTTFWLLSETIRTDRLFTFSSHSMSLQALVDVDFWQNDIVTEDSRIFLQCLVYYEGDYEVTPIYLPISMDTVVGRNFWETIVHQYKQIRRWAYGVENFPFMVWNFKSTKRIKLSTKLRYIWNQLEGEYSWATAPIIIFILGHLPLAVASETDRATVLYHTAPFLLQLLMSVAMIGLFVSAVLSVVILPSKPGRSGWLKKLEVSLQWLLFPITTVIFGSVPAIEAQTRLLFGRYLGFWSTAKVRPRSTELRSHQGRVAP